SVISNENTPDEFVPSAHCLTGPTALVSGPWISSIVFAAPESIRIHASTVKAPRPPKSPPSPATKSGLTSLEADPPTNCKAVSGSPWIGPTATEVGIVDRGGEMREPEK